MFTFSFVLCALVALFGFAAIACELLLEYYGVLDFEDDEEDYELE